MRKVIPDFQSFTSQEDSEAPKKKKKKKETKKREEIFESHKEIKKNKK